jgi:ATP-dependent Zn protease
MNHHEMNSENQASPYEYKALRSDDLNVIQELAQEGWEPVSVSTVMKGSRQPATGSRVIPLSRSLRYALLAVLALVMFSVLLFTFAGGRTPQNELPISSAIEDIRAGKITKIVAPGESNRLTLCYGDCKADNVRTVHKEEDISMLEMLDRSDIPRESWPAIEVRPAPTWGNYLGLLFSCLPIILLVAVLVTARRLPMRLAQESELLIILKRVRGGDQG